MRYSIPLLATLAVLAFSALSLTALSPVTYAQSSTTTVLTLTPSTVDRGQSSILSATVTPASGSAPSGTVGFYAGSALFATATLNNAGTASLALSSANIAPGTYPVTAKYNGNATDSASTSSPVTATILADTTTTLSSASSSYVLGQPATVTASVSSKAGTPTGSVHFFYGTTLLGSATLKAGSASFTETIPADYEAGSYRITAKYEGSSYYAPSSGSFTVSLNFTISPDGAAIATAATQQFSLSPTVSGTATWYVNGIPGGNSSVGTISSSGLYTALTTTSPLSLEVTASAASSPHYTTAAVPLYVMPAGVVATTNNGQVASYTIDLPAGATVSAQFGTTTSYGLNTWSLPAPTGGGSTQLLVAGMMAKTLYHIQGLVSLPGGLTFTDHDNQFTTTNSLPTYYAPQVAVTTTPGYTPQPGVEFLDQLTRSANIFDLAGNFLWGWPGVQAGTYVDEIQPFKLLSNGHLLINESPDSTYQLNGGSAPNGTVFQMVEVDYADTIIHQLTLATLQANLDASGYVNSLGQQITLSDIHHDMTLNPVTGHWILISNTYQNFTSLPGYPKGVSVLGDVIIDVDPNNDFAVDWVWNEFDHLDINRQPMSFPDWTHSNAIVYSTDDHNILVSIRHQNWVVKIDYDDGAGDGTILWHLGYQGDFTLVGGNGTQDWQYAQHGPSFTTPNTTGVFGLALMDNGDDRVFPDGFTCPVPKISGGCYYSRAPIFTIDENAMTATVSNGQLGPVYSFWGGNAELLQNGNIEADYTDVNDTNNSLIVESTQGVNPTAVWQMNTTNATTQYRAFRQLSPYPGVTWSAAAEQFQADHATHPAKISK
jgi:arylsulfate sulfotransferase